MFAFACEPAWLEANAPADGKPALPRFSMVAYTGGPMRLAEVLEAQKAVLSIARKLAADGTIMLNGKGDDYV